MDGFSDLEVLALCAGAYLVVVFGTAVTVLGQDWMPFWGKEVQDT